jgi:hypothetical protein
MSATTYKLIFTVKVYVFKTLFSLTKNITWCSIPYACSALSSGDVMVTVKCEKIKESYNSY